LSSTGLILAILFFVFFLGGSDNQIISPLLPLMAQEFGFEAGEVGKWLVPAYSLAAASAALLVGPASDKFGRRRFLLFASALFSLSLISVAVVDDIRALAISRFFTGLAAGTFSTCSIAYVGDYFPYARRGMAMSVVQAGYFAAMAFGVPGGSLLADWQGWRAGFVLFGLLSLVAFGLILTLLPEDKHDIAEDLSTRVTRRFHNIRVILESRQQLAAIAAGFFVSAGFVGFILYLGSWLTSRFGLSTGEIGLAFVLMGVASLIGAAAGGSLSDKFGKRGLSILSTVMLAAMLFLIPKLGWGILLLISLLFMSLVFAFRQGPLQALATELVPRGGRGSLIAMRNIASQIGIAVSSVVSGLLYDQLGYNAVGLFCTVLTLIAAICIFLVREPCKRSESC
jgi:predicted MFS family arabinose efflux permease